MPSEELPANDRAQRADAAGKWLAGRVIEVVRDNPTIGGWDETWVLVEEPSRRFSAALKTWQETGTGEDYEAVKKAADDVVAAWREACTKHAVALNPLKQFR